MNKNLTIAVDGPAGSGKSTVCSIVAQRLGLYHLDTGAMYRAIGYTALKRNITRDDRKAVLEMINCIKTDVTFDENKKQHVFVDGEDVTPYIRTNEVSMAASDFATIPEVRQKLVEMQRQIAEKYPVILDGRDICKYVLPNADVKIFLTAKPEERARRRLLELTEKGLVQNKTLEEMTREIKERDEQDSKRKISPLVIAEDAEVIDTTGLCIDSVCDIIIEMARTKR